MSVAGDNDIYGKMMSGDVHEAMSSDYIYLKYDNSDEKTSENEQEHTEVITDHNNIFLESSDREVLEEIASEKQVQYFEPATPSAEETEHANEQHYEIKLADVKEEWTHPTDISKEEELITGNVLNAHTSEAVDDDEETIAIFATAAGQELALYRVDGSDEIYAVSLFDESGEPPTSFEYLMSSDVERLIKQGAVRTVKKPSGLKSQLVATPAPTIVREQPVKHTYEYKPKPKYKDTRPHKIWESTPIRNKFIRNTTNTVYSIIEKQPDVNYVMLENFEKEEEMLEELESEDELIQESTVQYLLCDDDQSDSELTFDDIRHTLENVKAVTKPAPKTEVKKKPEESTNGLIPTKSVVQRHSVRPNIMQTHRRTVKNNSGDPKPTYFKEGNAVFLVEDFGDVGKENSATSTPAKLEMKVKRPRKQKLTSVNRGDSEIIIQPASMIEEEEEMPVKKRYRRKRKVLPDPDYNPRTPTRKMRKMRKHSRVEVIDIDMEEDDNQETIEEITLDDGKEKNSSDKENNVIMVGDSDEDSQESNEKMSPLVLKCHFCSRNFRQRRLLDTHIRICSKTRSKKVEKTTDSTERRFTCKTCSEKFDAALTLARHVRANHPQRRGRPRKITQVPVDDDEDYTDEMPSSSSSDKTPEKSKDIDSKVTVKITRSMTKENKITESEKPEKKPKQRLKVLSKESLRKHMGIHFCIQCWKISSCLKEARDHILQHETKSTLIYCKICKSIAPGRIALIQHMKTHIKKAPVIKPVVPPKVVKEPVKEEEPPVVVPRKRGRPRKIKPVD